MRRVTGVDRLGHNYNRAALHAAGGRRGETPVEDTGAVAREQAFGTGGILSGTGSCARARRDAVFRPLILPLSVTDSLRSVAYIEG